jgi:hypothetical protein
MVERVLYEALGPLWGLGSSSILDAVIFKKEQGYNIIVLWYKFYSDIAQLVEQLTVNQFVPGSSPGVGAIFWTHSSIG